MVYPSTVSTSVPGYLPHRLTSPVGLRRNLIGSLSSSRNRVQQRAFDSGRHESCLIGKYKRSTIFGSEALIHIGPFSCSPVAANAPLKTLVMAMKGISTWLESVRLPVSNAFIVFLDVQLFVGVLARLLLQFYCQR